MGAVDVVALLNGVDMAGVFTVQNTAVVLPRFHHHGKVGQLVGAVINVEAIEVVFQNVLGGIPLAVPGILIHLHQYIEGIDQNMAAAHAGVNDLDVSHIRVGALLLDLVQLLAHFPRLGGFWQVILPAHLLRNKLFVGDPLILDFIPSHLIQTTPIGKDTFVLPLVDEETA